MIIKMKKGEKKKNIRYIESFFFIQFFFFSNAYQCFHRYLFFYSFNALPQYKLSLATYFLMNHCIIYISGKNKAPKNGQSANPLLHLNVRYNATIKIAKSSIIQMGLKDFLLSSCFNMSELVDATL